MTQPPEAPTQESLFGDDPDASRTSEPVARCLRQLDAAPMDKRRIRQLARLVGVEESVVRDAHRLLQRGPADLVEAVQTGQLQLRAALRILAEMPRSECEVIAALLVESDMPTMAYDTAMQYVTALQELQRG
jgi:hypothetical protein